ncbi:hypothetical protein [Pseudomonas sp. LA5]|uniref:hypothetical protein n=1 Tax=Pseudomonas sp. LA5 TaxID=3027850 RepID=UPI00235FD31D|nr:hypothetical protein [Pseudomonas sp. LA5]
MKPTQGRDGRDASSCLRRQVAAQVAIQISEVSPMRLSSAREEWHKAFYRPGDGTNRHCESLALVGQFQDTERVRGVAGLVNETIGAHVRSVVERLPADLFAFGNHLYHPDSNDLWREVAEWSVFQLAYLRGPKMYAKKYARAEFVAMAVLYRYRRQHQGGQSAAPDPLPTPEAFRTYLEYTYGVELDARNWDREWEEFVQACFAACNDLDAMALAPVARLLRAMKCAA